MDADQVISPPILCVIGVYIYTCLAILSIIPSLLTTPQLNEYLSPIFVVIQCLSYFMKKMSRDQPNVEMKGRMGGEHLLLLSTFHLLPWDSQFIYNREIRQARKINKTALVKYEMCHNMENKCDKYLCIKSPHLKLQVIAMFYSYPFYFW